MLRSFVILYLTNDVRTDDNSRHISALNFWGQSCFQKVYMYVMTELCLNALTNGFQEKNDFT